MDLSQTLVEYLSPTLTVMLGIVGSLALKDAATSFIKGFLFRLDPLFNEGDHVIIDDEHAIIVKIGFRNSIFGVHKDDGTYIWRYVQNERMAHRKLEKIIDGPQERKFDDKYQKHHNEINKMDKEEV